MHLESASASTETWLSLRVASKQVLATGIVGIGLCHPQGLSLPAYSAGAHVTVCTPGGMRRNYSLCGEPGESQLWQIAVKRDAAGRGGSISMADDVAQEALLKLDAPITRTPGYIGFMPSTITSSRPIFAMARSLWPSSTKFGLLPNLTVL